jgi:tripartite-type tricarboxylate transporter receptor subunit TctC
MIRMTGVALAALLTASLAGQVIAQEFPQQRPITFVVGLGAGGGTDINARIFADAISRNMGQRVVVDNRTGVGGGVAAAYVQGAAPDGHTLLIMSGLQHAYLPATQPGLYEPVKGFAPVTTFFEMISMLTVPTVRLRTSRSSSNTGRRSPTVCRSARPALARRRICSAP